LYINGQPDTIGPIKPVLKLVNVDHLTGNVEIFWEKSPSPDVFYYVVYLYQKDEMVGFPLDTIYDISETNYTRTNSGSSFYSESFVIQALDSVKNFSTFSNALSTIYTEAGLDSCNTKLEIKWNSYSSDPVRVLNYSVLNSVDGGPFSEVAQLTADKTNFIIDDFDTDKRYCFIVKADLENGQISGSNKVCLLTKMQKPPQWINADFATVRDDNKIELSFSVDPLSEINSYRIERKTGNDGDYEQIHQFTSSDKSLSYIDNKADISKINYYRIAALNNCGTPVTYSNICSNIVLSVFQNSGEIKLEWNAYREWTGGIGSYRLYANPGDGFTEIETISPDDTVIIMNYRDIMYEVSGDEICFILKAFEASNPYGEPGESSSRAVCVQAEINIIIPDTFTPDGNGINDLFFPVFSFTPEEYYLLITDLRRRKIFETRNFMDKWDGRFNGALMPEGAYLWMLKIRTPSGDTITKSGTLTLIFNR
jgi:gliding motility-associated-like protein